MAAKRRGKHRYVYIGEATVYVPDLGRVVEPGDDKCDFTEPPESPLFVTPAEAAEARKTAHKEP